MLLSLTIMSEIVEVPVVPLHPATLLQLELRVGWTGTTADRVSRPLSPTPRHSGIALPPPGG